MAKVFNHRKIGKRDDYMDVVIERERKKHSAKMKKAGLNRKGITLGDLIKKEDKQKIMSGGPKDSIREIITKPLEIKMDNPIKEDIPSKEIIEEKDFSEEV